MSTIIFQVQSSLILALLYFGVFKKSNRLLHAKIMKISIAWDILLVLQIELTRHAIAKAVRPNENSALLNFHILIAVTVVILYVFLFILGQQLLKNNFKNKKRHKVLGILALLLRTSTYITSYLIQV